MKMQEVAVKSPFKTERPKGGIRMIRLEPGDRIKVGGDAFEVTRVLGDGRVLVRGLHAVRERHALS